ncbi:MAG: CHASE2 domain-containing protein [Kiloniellales bacterium]|nr:CHASE2 domain-containing protein [Kiloniellales bacterium]
MSAPLRRLITALRRFPGVGRLRAWLPRLAIFTLVAAVYLGDGLEFLERSYLDLRFDLLRRPASGDAVLVEVDAKSLQELEAWPWPRRYHAEVLVRLIDAGAEMVAFGIDLSSPSAAAEDAALERALAGSAGRAILPAFMQKVPAEDGGVDLALNLPLTRFARHATVAGVDMQPDSDGVLRRMSVLVPWGGDQLVALGALLTQRRDLPEAGFYLDFGIRVEDVPRFSFADVLAGRVDEAALRGKRVILGATAVELGEQVAVPAYGILPGPLVQIMAYETIAQDRAIARLAPLPVLLVSLLLIFGLTPRIVGQSWRRSTLFTAFGALGLFGLSLAVQASFPLSLDAAPWQLSLLCAYLYGLGLRVDRQDLGLLAQGLELRRKDALMRQVVEHSFDAIVTIDSRGRIASFNRAAERIFGRRAAETEGRKATLLAASAQESEAQTRLALGFHLLRGGPFELLGQRADGERFNLELVVSEMVVQEERLAILRLRDITVQRRAEAARKAAQRRLEEAIGAMRDGFAMFDAESRLLLCNTRFRDLHAIGWQTPLEGRTHEDILRAFAAESPAHQLRESRESWIGRQLARHKGARRSFEAELAEGTVARISQHRTRDGGLVCVYTDVTELHRRQQELLVAKEEAEAARRSMSGFLANMSHELRTPLNAIIGFSSMMKDEMVGPLGDKAYKSYANDIHASGSLLLDIINDVLDVSKIEAGKHRIEEDQVQVGQLLNSCLRLIGTRASAAGLSLERRSDLDELELRADPRALKQILLNLLSNAIKFTPRGGRIELVVLHDAEGDVLFQVSDDGIGMAAEDIPRALAVFGQIESDLASRHQGTGLGLPLAQRLTEMHGGTLELESAPGRGTNVTVRLPAARVLAPGPGARSETPRRQRRKRRVANEG